MLFMPGDKPRMHEKARTLDADAIILDMEDAVAEEAKISAREIAAQSLRKDAFPMDVLVRINHPDSPHFGADVKSLQAVEKLNGIVIPKVEDADTVQKAADALPHLPLWANIETPKAVLQLETIAQSDKLSGIIAGVNDLKASLQIPPTSEWQPRTGLHHTLSHMVLVARAYGLAVMDGVYNRITDLDGLKSECAEGRTLGFDGKSLIHPSHLDITNRAFTPSEEELQTARALVQAYETSSGGAIRLGGEMVEELHVRRARAVLQRHETTINRH